MKQIFKAKQNDIQVSLGRGNSTLFYSIWLFALMIVIFTAGCKKEELVDVVDPVNSANGLGPNAINLLSAGSFTILTATGISTTGTTSILGDIGTSPVSSTGITGFGLTMDASNQFSISSLVTGKVYGPGYAEPTPTKMTTAINDMKTAFTTANGLTTDVIVELHAGDLSGQTLKPGLYKWDTGVLITNVGVTLNGGANDVWVFQIAQNLIVNNSAMITLQGGAQAKNIFWVVSGEASIGTYTNFSGNILSKTLISLNTGAKVTGRLLAQTAVTMIANDVKPE